MASYVAVAKKSGLRVSSDNIAAIRLGFTTCAVAYALCDFEGAPMQLPLNERDFHVPTAVLFKPDGTIDSFGYDAREQYLMLDHHFELKEYAYFERSITILQHHEVELLIYER